MAALVWVMMGLALWHFTIFLPDHFWAGIVGAFVGAVLGALIFGFLIHGLSVPGQNDTNVLNALEAIPGAMLGMAVIYWIGLRQEREHPIY
jgi:ABC-type xylose transport system permease subunit